MSDNVHAKSLETMVEIGEDSREIGHVAEGAPGRPAGAGDAGKLGEIGDVISPGSGPMILVHGR
jgi:hypothetical protein